MTARMIRIAINQAAFDAIAKTLPLGSVAYEPAVEEGVCATFGWRRGGSTG
jgi:hypothetical protein